MKFLLSFVAPSSIIRVENFATLAGLKQRLDLRAIG